VPPVVITTLPGNYTLSQSPLESDAVPSQPAPLASVAAAGILTTSLPAYPNLQQVREAAAIMSDLTPQPIKEAAIAAATPVLKEKATADTDEDQYNTPEYQEEVQGKDFVANLFSWTGYHGTFSTKREQAIFKEGAKRGRTLSILGTLADCPPKWAGERQYYDSGQMLGYFEKLAAICIVVNFGGVALAMKLLGVA
jgi:hypothetical protein